MFSFKFTKTIARSISVLSLSFFAFQNTAFGLPRYAKVVILGSIGSGKSTIKKIFKQDFSQEYVHDKQLSNIQVPVFYNKKGEFTFDEEKAYGKYKKEVILTICDTPADKSILDCVNDFASKGTVVLVLLADARNFSDNWDGCKYCPHFMNVLKKFQNNDCRKIFILSHCDNNNSSDYNKFMAESQLLALKKFSSNIDEVKTLTLYNGDLKEEIAQSFKKVTLDDEDESDSEDKKIKELQAPLSISNSKYQIQSNVASVGYLNTAEHLDVREEKFNKNSKAELIKYGKVILNMIAKSVWKYGFDKLPLDNLNTNYHIEDKKDFKVGKQTTKVWGLFKDTYVNSDKVETFYKPSLTAGNK